MESLRLFFALFFQWKVKTKYRDLINAQVVMTHEFGDQHTLSATTAQIVDVGCHYAKELNIPLICQFPGQIEARLNKVEPMFIITKNMLDEGGYLDTQEANRQVAEICKEKEWSYVLVSAHPDHVWRVAKNLKRFGLIPLVPDLSSVHYDKKCTRFSLAHRWVFLPRELMARLRDFFKGHL